MAKKKRGRQTAKEVKPTYEIDSGDENKLEKWNVNEEGFYKDEVDKYLEEKEILSLQRSGHHDSLLKRDQFSEEEEGSDEEVLDLGLSGSELDEEMEEEEEIEEEEAVEGEEIISGPSDKAWGKRKKDFYNTDYIDDEGEDTSDESLAEEEEREALSLQQRMLQSLHSNDFGLDTVPKLTPLTNLDLTTEGPVNTQPNMSTLSKSERLKFIQEEWPEFLQLYNDLKMKEKIISDILKPFMKRLNKNPTVDSSPQLIPFVSTLMTLYNLYCLNVAFYLTLCANGGRGGVPVEDHPVMSRIISLRELLSQVEHFVSDEKLAQIENHFASYESNIFKKNDSITTKKRNLETTDLKEEDPLEFYERIKRAKLEKKMKKVSFTDDTQRFTSEQDEEEGEGGDKKRGVTYQIARNKGMTPKRKKEQRNPRVKHRKKFEKAITRHRSMVRPVEKELKRYGGEKGGIRSRLARSTKIK